MSAGFSFREAHNLSIKEATAVVSKLWDDRLRLIELIVGFGFGRDVSKIDPFKRLHEPLTEWSSSDEIMSVKDESKMKDQLTKVLRYLNGKNPI